MRKKTLSPLGYIMENLHIQTAAMSRSIHVDASLVSKWKSGNRNLSSKSVYFEDIIDFIMDYSTNDLHYNLINALLDLYPHESADMDEAKLEILLRQTLTNKIPERKSPQNQLLSEFSDSVSALIFEQKQGRRDAVDKMISFAEKMPSPGEFIFVDNEEFEWLLEDHMYAQNFVRRFEKLIHKGFRAIFVLHHASYKGKFIKLFDECSPLIFHRNITWYYNEYYDESLLNFSFYLLNHAISLVGISANNSISSTMVFTDNSLVIQHELMARHIIEQCNPIFTNFNLPDVKNVIHDVSLLRKKGNFYSYLPVPMFISVYEDLLSDILEYNQIEPIIQKKCLSINHMIRNFLSTYLDTSNSSANGKIIYLFHLEELLERAEKKEIHSRSLGLVCGQHITITPKHYAIELRNLANKLLETDNMLIVLISDHDQVVLPSINCWCKQDIWMLQMNKQGLRLSNEYNIVNASSTKWERCVHVVPSERKEKKPVSQFLYELADKLDS